jgi:hypothetical protein
MSASTPEGRITEKILRHLNARPHCVARKVVASAMNRKGEPDIDCVRYGRAIKLEVKQPGTEHAIVAAVTPLQRRRLLDYADAGAIAHVVTSVEEVIALLDCPAEEHELTARVRSRLGTIALESGA